MTRSLRHIRLGVSTRVVEADSYTETRDALAQDWYGFFQSEFSSGSWMLLPNIGEEIGDYMVNWQVNAVLLTGGNDLGTCQSRDLTETEVLRYAVDHHLPVFGVCRGLQVINRYFGGKAADCDREMHVASHHEVRLTESGREWVDQVCLTVNSYHGFAIRSADLAEALIPLACSIDDGIEAAIHNSLPIAGVMWHPERDAGPTPLDQLLFHKVLSSAGDTIG